MVYLPMRKTKTKLPNNSDKPSIAKPTRRSCLWAEAQYAVCAPVEQR